MVNSAPSPHSLPPGAGVRALIATNRLRAVMDSFRTEKLLSELGEYNIELPLIFSMHKVCLANLI